MIDVAHPRNRKSRTEVSTTNLASAVILLLGKKQFKLSSLNFAALSKMDIKGRPIFSPVIAVAMFF
jgi:hypothetical protein